MQQPENNALAYINGVERDLYIAFYDQGHKYEILTDRKSKYTSVTTWVHSHFPKFNADEVIRNMMNGKNWTPENKYWGLSPEHIKRDWNKNGSDSAKAGTKLHKQIEDFMNLDELKDDPSIVSMTHAKLIKYNQIRDSSMGESELEERNSKKEWGYFMQFTQAHPDMVPYRTEWMIYDETLKLAGSVDMVYINPDGTLSIYDWKRSKEIVKNNGFGKSAVTECINYLPDANFWHYALQLNTYKLILERNYGKTVSSLRLVRLHPDAENDSYEVLAVPIMEAEMNALVEQRLSMKL